MATTHSSENPTEHAGRGLLDRRLVFLLGKGGVGRSTLAAALGLQPGIEPLTTLCFGVPASDSAATNASVRLAFILSLLCGNYI